MLYEKHNYLDRSVEFVINREIIEYDMKSAGFNLIRKYELLNPAQIDMLTKMPKQQQTIQIGIMQRTNPELNKALKAAFIVARKDFFEANNVKNDEVLSIKKDAIIMLRPCQNLEFGEVVFVPKNFYTSYYYLNRLEMYYNENTFDVKGISDELLELHVEGMIAFLHQFCYYMEAGSQKITTKYLTEFADYYRNRKLPVEYYRELSRDSMFEIDTIINGKTYTLSINETENKDDLDIRYNYMNYLVPLISLLA